MVSIRWLVSGEGEGNVVEDIDAGTFEEDLPGETVGPAVADPFVAVWFGDEAGDAAGGVGGEPEGLAVLPVRTFTSVDVLRMECEEVEDSPKHPRQPPPYPPRPWIRDLAVRPGLGSEEALAVVLAW